MAMCIFVGSPIASKAFIFSFPRNESCQDSLLVVLHLLRFDIQFLSKACLCVCLTCFQPLNSRNLTFSTVGE